MAKWDDDTRAKEEDVLCFTHSTALPSTVIGANDKRLNGFVIGWRAT